MKTVKYTRWELGELGSMFNCSWLSGLFLETDNSANGNDIMPWLKFLKMTKYATTCENRDKRKIVRVAQCLALDFEEKLSKCLSVLVQKLSALLVAFKNFWICGQKYLWIEQTCFLRLLSFHSHSMLDYIREMIAGVWNYLSN